MWLEGEGGGGARSKLHSRGGARSCTPECDGGSGWGRGARIKGYLRVWWWISTGGRTVVVGRVAG